MVDWYFSVFAFTKCGHTLIASILPNKDRLKPGNLTISAFDRTANKGTNWRTGRWKVERGNQRSRKG